MTIAKNTSEILCIGFVKRSVMEVGTGSLKFSNLRWWAISNQATKKLKNCKIIIASIYAEYFSSSYACYGRESILKWKLDLGYFDTEFFIIVVQSAAYSDQLKIII